MQASLALLDLAHKASCGQSGGMVPRRLVQLYAGLMLYGVSLALMVRAALGLDPWDVFHQGLARSLGWSLGSVVIAVGALVLVLWIPLRQRPGLGTVSNVIIIGLAVDVVLRVLPHPDALAIRVVLLALGIALNGVATAAYVGAGFGAGPRDGLSTGLVRRTGRTLRQVRTAVEVTVLVVGWVLGGSVGVGTVAYALTIGPLVHALTPLLTVAPPTTPAPDRAVRTSTRGRPARP